MRTSNFAKGRRVAGLFRLCLATLVILTLAVGGMALNTKPVQAAIVNPAAVNNLALVECVPWAQQFNVNPQCPGSAIFFWTVGGVVPGWANVNPLTGELTCCPGIGTAGTPASNFTILCSEMAPWPSPCWPVVLFAIPVSLQVTVPAPTPPGTPPNCALTIDPVFYPVAWENMPFAMTLTATGNVGTLNWSATGLPTGLTVTDTANGIIGGAPVPGTCGIWNVTATVTDTGICPGPNCCPPTVNRPFVLIVDCWANYIGYLAPSTHTDSFTVRIGPNLTQGQTNVFIDGIQKAKLGANQSQTFTTQTDELHLVTADQTVTGPNNTMFEVNGANQIVVGGTVTEAYFDYAQKVFIKTGSDPTGVSEPPGAGSYAIGGIFSTTTPGTVVPPSDEDVKYVFKEFKLPDGSTNPNRDLWFTVTKAGEVKAEYETYYLLRLESKYPPVAVDQSSWELANTTAMYSLALQPVRMLGLGGILGGIYKPTNASGDHFMTGHYTQEINWKSDYTGPIIAILVILLLIGGLGYVVYRLKVAPTRQVITKKEAPAPKPKSKRQRTTKTTVKPKQRYIKKTGGSKTTGRRAR